MSLQPEALLGPYRILGLIGEGGMGAVYRARDTRLGRDVAVKVLTNISLGDKERLQRFEQEARATGMLNHPNLLTIYDIGNADGTPFLVSELLEGETLRERIDRGAVPPRKAVEAALQIAHGLAAAHEKGIVHRDLKPENVFVTRDGRVKILDFGIAKLSAGMSSDGPTFSPAATEPGMVLGTVGYMSPEQVRGEAVDARSDIFAFGTILYEMLTGQRAFKRGSGIETLAAILREEPPDVSEVNASVPPTLDRLVRRCLEKNRDQRFQSARDLAFNLETLSTVSGGGAGTFAGGTANPFAAPSESAPLPAARTNITSAPTLLSQNPPPAAAQKGAPPPAMATATSIKPAAPRPVRPTIAARKPVHRTSRILIGLLFVVVAAGAALGGWYAAERLRKAGGELAYHRITFRRGEVRSARFSPDGDTIVYSASWDGRPPEIFVATRQSADARPLGIGEAEILAVSKSTELAVLLRRDRVTGVGTLARVPLSGGLPREVAESVTQADWSPDGSTLAVVRIAGGKYRIEAPAGTIRYESGHLVRDIRYSPDGTRIAFLESIRGETHVSILQGQTPVSIAHGWPHGAAGLAWSPDGKQIWISGTATEAPPALYAIDASDSAVQPLTRTSGSMKLFDISSAGRVLLTTGMWRAAIEYQPPGQAAEQDASWLDWSILADLTPDGSSILFNETREGGGAKRAVYVRRAGSAVPVRIGDGFGDALSPNGKLALCHGEGGRLTVVPTGTGEARELKIQGSFDYGASWFPDNRRVVVAGAVGKGAYRLQLLDTLDETIRPLSPDNIAGNGTVTRPFALSPDGRFVAGLTAESTIALYPTEGNGAPLPVTAAQPGEVPVQFSADGMLLYVYRPSAMPQQVYRLNLSSGTRELWKEFTPTDPAGVYKITPIVMTPDASSYAYNALRTTSDLYVVEGLR